MYISSWKKVYEGLENQEFKAYLVTSCFDVNLGIIKFKTHIDYMDDLIITIINSEENQILQYNSLDAAALEENRNPFLQGLFDDVTVPMTYYRIKFPKMGVSLHFRKNCK